MTDLQRAVSRILHPIVRVLIARGIQYPQLVDWLKPVYLTVSNRYYQVAGKRLTDSRLHILTGLQRKDIRALRAAPEADPQQGAGPLSRITALWLAEHAASDGAPQPLPLRGDAPSFQALVAEVSRDVHPRTMLDELIRLDLAELDDNTLKLKTDAFLPAADEAALLGYFGANLGDHALAAAANVLAAPDPGPHFERAVHYNTLTKASVSELEALSRKLLGEAMNSLNARAAQLQKRDRNKTDAGWRFRAGAFVYRQSDEEDFS